MTAMPSSQSSSLSSFLEARACVGYDNISTNENLLLGRRVRAWVWLRSWETQRRHFKRRRFLLVVLDLEIREGRMPRRMVLMKYRRKIAINE
ncbi:hypothetical protein BS47DRAFT_1338473 [Hydnum rufescens UP504]|uniref:Uncharacterized protein n=1 Tax=Hydnum rufescens UP504 TaxID=1448309 RepID=A0A9P6B766_9AGAM|nr:hypothetical protein BS47DRAFT_1338473 [Hydnum rufescens UP504]